MHHFNFHVLDEKMNDSVARYSQIDCQKHPEHDVFFKVICLGGVALLLDCPQSDHLYFFFFDAHWSSAFVKTANIRESYQDGTVYVYINDLTLGDNLMLMLRRKNMVLVALRT